MGVGVGPVVLARSGPPEQAGGGKATAASGEQRAELWKQVFAKANQDIITDIPMFHMVGFTRVSPRLDFQPTIATNSELQLSQIGFK